MPIRQMKVDDYSGEPLPEDVEPLRVSVGVDAWNLYLSEDSKEKLQAALSPFTDDADRATSSTRSGTGSGTATKPRATTANKAVTTSGKTAREVREALREHGYTVADQGRFSAEQKANYETSTGDKFL